MRTGKEPVADLAAEAAGLLDATVADIEELLRSGLPASVSSAARTVLASVVRRSKRLSALIREELDVPVPDPSFLRRLVGAARPVAVAGAASLAVISGATEGGTSALVAQSIERSGELLSLCAEADAASDESAAFGIRIDGSFYVVSSAQALVIGAEPKRLHNGDQLAILSPPNMATADSQLRFFVDSAHLYVDDQSSSGATYLTRRGTTEEGLLAAGRPVQLRCGDRLRVDDYVLLVI